MSIALVVTAGFGNGTLAGSIKDVVLRGYSVGGAVTTDIRYGVTRFSVPAVVIGAGSPVGITVTIPDLGFTPKAVRLTYGGGTTNGTNQTTCTQGMGMADVNDQFSVSYDDVNGVSTPGGRVVSTTSFALGVNTTGIGDGAIALDALNTLDAGPVGDGWKFFLILGSGEADLVTCEFFGGDDLEVFVTNFQYDGTAFSGVGFQPNLVFLSTVFNIAPNFSANPDNSVSFGAAWDGPSIQQGSISQCMNQVLLTTSPAQLWSTANIISNIVDGTPPTNQFAADVTSFDADGITINVNTGSLPDTSIALFAMFMNIGDKKAFIGAVDAPLSVGVAEVDLGFPPQAVTIMAGVTENFNVNQSGADAEALCIGHSDGTSNFSVGACVRSDQPSDILSRRYAKDSAVFLVDYGTPAITPSDGTTRTLFEVTDLTFSNSGFSYTTTIVDTSIDSQRQWMVFAIEGDVISPGIRYGVTQFELPPENNDHFNVTIPGLGFTPKAVRMTYGGEGNGNNIDNGVMGVGFATADEQGCVSTLSEIGMEMNQPGRSIISVVEIMAVEFNFEFDPPIVGLSIVAEGTSESGPIVDGWRFFGAVSDSSSGHFVTVEFFGGDDLQVEVSNFVYTGSPLTGLSFEPNFVFLNTNFQRNLQQTTTLFGKMGLGAAWNGTEGIQQGSVGVCNGAQFGPVPITPTQHWSSENIISSVLDTGVNPFTAQVTSFDSNGITLVVNNGAIPNGEVSVLGLFMNIGSNAAFVGEVEAPTSTGSLAVDIGFEPAMVNITAGTALSFNQNLRPGEAVSLGYSDGVRQSSSGMCVRDGLDEILARRYINDSALFLVDYGPPGTVTPTDTRTLYDVDSLTFTDSGFNMVSSVVDASSSIQKIWFVAAIGVGGFTPVPLGFSVQGLIDDTGQGLEGIITISGQGVEGIIANFFGIQAIIDIGQSVEGIIDPSGQGVEATFT